jgi:hypothetical protein
MILLLLRRVVKATLHAAVEEWLAETGVSKEMIDEVRGRRKELARQKVEQADALAASRLDGEHDEEPGDVPALPMPAVARVTQPCEETEGLMGWVHQQREANAIWSDIAQTASTRCWQGTEDALRSRYKRWREKHAQGEESEKDG